MTPAHDYVIGTGDVVSVEVYEVPELSRDLRVSLTGTIGIPLVPTRLYVVGLTEMQLQRKIAEVLEANGLVTRPQVLVAVKEKKSKPITIVGAVARPMVFQADHPVTLVRFDDAVAYCAWLSASTGRLFRLPTEAEWEKASRGGVESKRYPWGDRLDQNMSNFLVDPGSKATHGTTPCRQYPANAFGLFDTAGNVWEWVQDWYDPGYYAISPVGNPVGPATGHLRVLRGGGWLVADVRMLSCSHRHKVPPDTYSYAIGFRLACLP